MRKRSYLTVRNLPADVSAELERERKRRGTSLNSTVVNVLRRGLGLGLARRSNGLARFAGTWNEDEFAEFEKTTNEFEHIDEERWR